MMTPTLVVKGTSWIHCSDSVTLPVVVFLAIPGMAALRPNTTLEVLLGIYVVVSDY